MGDLGCGAAGYDGTPTERAKRIVEVVAAGNPIIRRAAQMMG